MAGVGKALAASLRHCNTAGEPSSCASPIGAGFSVSGLATAGHNHKLTCQQTQKALVAWKVPVTVHHDHPLGMHFEGGSTQAGEMPWGLAAGMSKVLTGRQAAVRVLFKCYRQ